MKRFEIGQLVRVISKSSFYYDFGHLKTIQEVRTRKETGEITAVICSPDNYTGKQTIYWPSELEPYNSGLKLLVNCYNSNDGT